MMHTPPAMPPQLQGYRSYPAYPQVTPEQVNQARHNGLAKRDEWQKQSEEQATARRTIAVSYTAHRQNQAVVERYLQASGQETDSQSGPNAADVYQAANRYQRQQNLTDYLRFQQSTLAQQMGRMVGEDERKGTRLDMTA